MGHRNLQTSLVTRPGTPRLRGGGPPAPPKDGLAEFGLVSTLTEIALVDGTLPAQSVGTIIGIWAGGAAFEVEFPAPFGRVVTIERGHLAPHGPIEGRGSQVL